MTDADREALNRAGQGQTDPTLVNLASQEYFASVRTEALKLPLVTCLFKEMRPGEAPRALMLYAKQARGMMARFAIDNRIERADDGQHRRRHRTGQL